MSTNTDELDLKIKKMFADAKPMTQAELQCFGEKNREIMESPSFKAGVIEDQFCSDEQLAKALFFACSDMPCHKDAPNGKPYSWQDYLPCIPSLKEYLLIHQFTKQKTHQQTL